MDKKENQEVQEVKIVNEKPSVGSRIAEYGLFALAWHAVGTIFSWIFE